MPSVLASVFPGNAVDVLTEALPGTGEPRFDGADRDAECRSDLGMAKLPGRGQFENVPVLARQLPQRYPQARHLPLGVHPRGYLLRRVAR